MFQDPETWVHPDISESLSRPKSARVGSILASTDAAQNYDSNFGFLLNLVRGLRIGYTGGANPPVSEETREPPSVARGEENKEGRDGETEKEPQFLLQRGERLELKEPEFPPPPT